MTRLCPCCYRPYAFRVLRCLDGELRLTRHFRCGVAGRYLYVHRIATRPAGGRLRLAPQAATLGGERA